MTFIQNFSALSLANNENGKRPNSPYTVKLGVDRLTPNKVLQNLRLPYFCRHPYFRPINMIGGTILSNNDSFVFISR